MIRSLFIIAAAALVLTIVCLGGAAAIVATARAKRKALRITLISRF